MENKVYVLAYQTATYSGDAIESHTLPSQWIKLFSTLEKAKAFCRTYHNTQCRNAKIPKETITWVEKRPGLWETQNLSFCQFNIKTYRIH